MDSASVAGLGKISAFRPHPALIEGGCEGGVRRKCGPPVRATAAHFPDIVGAGHQAGKQHIVLQWFDLIPGPAPEGLYCTSYRDASVTVVQPQAGFIDQHRPSIPDLPDRNRKAAIGTKVRSPETNR